MDVKMIQDVLAKATEDALSKMTPQPKTEDGALASAVANIAKAVAAISDKVDSLDKSVEKKTVETADSKIEKVASAVDALAKRIENMGKKPEDIAAEQPISGMKQADLLKTIESVVVKAIEGSKQAPKGKGKDEGIDDDTEIELGKDLNGEEDEPAKIAKVKKTPAQELDEYFGKSLGNIASRFTKNSGNNGLDAEELAEENAK
jgi:ubiquinone biosynthesis protein UbiJ